MSGRFYDADVPTLTIAFGAALIALGLAQTPREDAGHLRVMTYNIKHGQTNAACPQPLVTPGQLPTPDCNLDLQAAIAVIREHHPDIIGLQEIDRFWARSGYQDEPAVLATALGMEHRCYAANLNHPADSHADRPHQYGTLILSRFPIRTCSTTPLPRTGENEQRGFTLAVIDVRGVALQFYNTHLHVTQADRLLQTAAIAQAIDAAAPGAKIMVGDFNARPTATELEPLFARFTDAWTKVGVAAAGNPEGLTSPATVDGHPRNRIDYVLVSSAAAVGAAHVPDRRANAPRGRSLPRRGGPHAARGAARAMIIKSHCRLLGSAALLVVAIGTVGADPPDAERAPRFVARWGGRTKDLGFGVCHQRGQCRHDRRHVVGRLPGQRRPATERRRLVRVPDGVAPRERSAGALGGALRTWHDVRARGDCRRRGRGVGRRQQRWPGPAGQPQRLPGSLWRWICRGPW